MMWCCRRKGEERAVKEGKRKTVAVFGNLACPQHLELAHRTFSEVALFLKLRVIVTGVLAV